MNINRVFLIYAVFIKIIYMITEKIPENYCYSVNFSYTLF